MGRRRRGRTIEIKVLIPEEIYFRFEKKITDNFSTKPVYGFRSQLVTQLIVNWLEAAEFLPLSQTTPKEDDPDV